jgi:hypothetical protein
MKSITSLFVVAALAASVCAQAAPPSGHPSPAAAADMMQLPKSAPEALPYKGTVVSTIDANEYTYIEVTDGKKTTWLAASKMALKKGSVVRYEDGAVMTNFRSKLLNRTFPSVTFVNSVVVAK